MQNKWVFLGVLSCLSACTYVDNYMLGKDNTPAPHALTTLTAQKNIQVAWHIPVGDVRAGQSLKLTPLVRSGVVYVADTKGRVQAVQRKTGQPLWQAHVKQGILSGPAQGEGVLALGTAAPGVVVLRQSDGQILWHADVSSDVLATPVIAAHHVVVKTIDGRLYAFDRQTGEKKWVVDHGSPHLILKASASPQAVGDKLVVGFSDGSLALFDLRSGRQLWQRNLAYAQGASDVERLVDIDADPIIDQEVIYLASYQGYVGAWSLLDGQALWTKPSSVYKNMTMDADTLYMTDSHDVVWALDRRTGFVRWKQNGLKARMVTGPAVESGQVIVGDRMGVLHVIDARTGAFIARTTLKAGIEMLPVVSQQEVYVVTADGQLNDVKVGA